MVHLFSISKIEYYFPHPSKKLFTEPEEIEFYENFSYAASLRFVRIVALYKKIINREKKYKVEGDIGGRLMSIVYTIATMASLFT